MELRSLLAESPLFANLAPSALDALAGIATSLHLNSGERLCAEGDAADHLYIVATGRLRVSVGGTVIGYAGRLEPIGEIGLLSGELRTASVHAIRDSLLIQLRSELLLQFLIKNPTALVAITRVLITRLRENQRQIKLTSARSARTFAVICASPEIDAAGVARELHQRLGGPQACRLLDAAAVDRELGEGVAQSPPADNTGNTRLMEWLNHLERSHRFLIYSAAFSLFQIASISALSPGL